MEKKFEKFISLFEGEGNCSLGSISKDINESLNNVIDMLYYAIMKKEFDFISIPSPSIFELEKNDIIGYSRRK